MLFYTSLWGGIWSAYILPKAHFSIESFLIRFKLVTVSFDTVKTFKETNPLK